MMSYFQDGDHKVISHRKANHSTILLKDNNF